MPWARAHSQSVWQALFESEPFAREAFEEADQALGMRISSLCLVILRAFLASR